jgi:hypothetical protein
MLAGCLVLGCYYIKSRISERDCSILKQGGGSTDGVIYIHII